MTDELLQLLILIVDSLTRIQSSKLSIRSSSTTPFYSIKTSDSEDHDHVLKRTISNKPEPSSALASRLEADQFTLHSLALEANQFGSGCEPVWELLLQVKLYAYRPSKQNHAVSTIDKGSFTYYVFNILAFFTPLPPLP